MDEKRNFFRVKNKGDILAKYGSHSLDVIEVSSSGVAIIKKSIHIQKEGTLELNINHTSVKIKYELLRIEKKTMVLIFKNKEEIDKLFLILKQLKDERQ